MDFDPDREPVEPRDAAAVILVRDRPSGEAEVFLLRRHRKAKFMAQSFVFPGGIVDPGEDDLRLTAARELFEEAGVLLAPGADPAQLASWRDEHAKGEGPSFVERIAAEGIALDLDALDLFAHWITPSAEKRRYSAQFFLAELPAGQAPSFCNVETVDEAWVTPQEALERRAELRLPPPQLRTLLELSEAAPGGVAALRELAAARREHVAPIVPRLLLEEDLPHGFALVLPWDATYTTSATGAGEPLPADHPLAGGGSRFVMDADGIWEQR